MFKTKIKRYPAGNIDVILLSALWPSLQFVVQNVLKTFTKWGKPPESGLGANSKVQNENKTVTQSSKRK